MHGEVNNIDYFHRGHACINNAQLSNPRVILRFAARQVCIGADAI